MSVADAPCGALFTIPKEICRNFERASRLEWLDTNHTGGFAMGTVAGVNTRRYHGLLIGSLHPPADRLSILPRVEETVRWKDQEFELATVQYPGVVQPHGCELLEEFRIDPFPTWRYGLDGNAIEKSVCLLDGQQSVYICYQSVAACHLSVRLCLAYRDYHSLTHRNDSIQGRAEESSGRISFRPYSGMPVLTVFHSGSSWRPDGVWLLNNEYLRELDRGLDYREDLFSPGCLHFDLAPGRLVWLLATIEPNRFGSSIGQVQIDSLLLAEAERRHFDAPTDTARILQRALDQFRFVREDGNRSLIAGYPWFTDWSRDTLISLPALSAGNFPKAEPQQILQQLLSTRRRGLLPNRFSDQQSAPEYNSVDGSLWFFIAAHDWVRRTNDIAFLRDCLFPAAQDIIEWYKRGTDFEIRLDAADHLLSAGRPDTQLTWMDAKVGNSPVTPRNGKPVEINALWYNALRITGAWAGMLNLPRERDGYEAEAAVTRISFETKFWNPRQECLFDVLTDTGADASIRSNQIFAMSLPFPLLSRGRAQTVIEVIREYLMTPVGLRTLDPTNSSYRSHFRGSVAERDGAYHRGTVWPWLMGPFINAYLFAYDNSQEARSFCRALLNNLIIELTACCLGSLSEVYDGDPPRLPAGCPAQLWSVAQLMIALERLGPEH
jgi:predicted glycogen debranching enzyme